MVIQRGRQHLGADVHRLKLLNALVRPQSSPGPWRQERRAIGIKKDLAVDLGPNPERDRPREVRLELPRHGLRVWSLRARDQVNSRCASQARDFAEPPYGRPLGVPGGSILAQVTYRQFSQFVHHHKDARPPGSPRGVPLDDVAKAVPAQRHQSIIKLHSHRFEHSRGGMDIISNGETGVWQTQGVEFNAPAIRTLGTVTARPPSLSCNRQPPYRRGMLSQQCESLSFRPARRRPLIIPHALQGKVLPDIGLESKRGEKLRSAQELVHREPARRTHPMRHTPA